MELGGTGFCRAASLERRFRDIQAARYHPLRVAYRAGDCVVRFVGALVIDSPTGSDALERRISKAEAHKICWWIAAQIGTRLVRHRVLGAEPLQQERLLESSFVARAVHNERSAVVIRPRPRKASLNSAADAN
jgi:hypothetical protein